MFLLEQVPDNRRIPEEQWPALLAPWYRGRVLVIGDAAHATTSHMVYGCELAVEDALVLAEELSGAPAAIEPALRRFMERRFECCKTVVEGSVQLGQIEMAQGSLEEHSKVTASVSRVISQPI